MEAFIAYPNEDGSVTFLYPAKECGLTLEQMAKKDTPVGVPYCFVPWEYHPNDHTFFNAFEMDFSNPDGYGADFGFGSRNAVIGWNQDGSPKLAWIEYDSAGMEYLVYPEERNQ